MFGGNWSQGKIRVSFLGAGTYCTLSAPCVRISVRPWNRWPARGGFLSGQRSEGIQQRRSIQEAATMQRSYEGLLGRAKERQTELEKLVGLLAEVSSLPSPIGSQGINSYSLVENSELWGMRSDHPTRKLLNSCAYHEAHWLIFIIRWGPLVVGKFIHKR